MQQEKDNHTVWLQESKQLLKKFSFKHWRVKVKVSAKETGRCQSPFFTFEFLLLTRILYKSSTNRL